MEEDAFPTKLFKKTSFYFWSIREHKKRTEKAKQIMEEDAFPTKILSIRGGCSSCAAEEEKEVDST